MVHNSGEPYMLIRDCLLCTISLRISGDRSVRALRLEGGAALAV